MFFFSLRFVKFTCVQATVGIGLPVYGIAILNSSPTLTLISLDVGSKSRLIFGATEIQSKTRKALKSKT